MIWSLLAASAVFWILRLVVSAPPAPAYAVAVGRPAGLHGDLARLFGAAPVTLAAAPTAREAPSRFRLLGVMAPRSSVVVGAGDGVALIAVDGKPAKAYTVGARVEPDLVLQSVGLRSARMASSRGTGAVTLELPAPVPAATGVLPPSGYGSLPVPGMGTLPAPAMAAAPAIGTPVPSAVPVLSGPLPATMPAPTTAVMPQPPIVAPPSATAPTLDPTRSQ